MSIERLINCPIWLETLAEEIEKPYVKSLFEFIEVEKQKGKTIYPQEIEYFHALNLTPLNKVKVVILGQDPYHGEGQAHGLSFSVRKGVKTPPSLRNIYKELHKDLSCEVANHGDLSKWAEQGVLLLNSVLSVEKGCAASHKNKGWEILTNYIISQISDRCQNVVFLLWGAYAQKKGKTIDTDKHLVLQSVHPSPLSAHRGFIGCGHFSKTNRYLRQNNLAEIDWQIE